ncbi:MAG TPA: 3-dehydroquinate synthase family protein [Acidimicrobiales bacterium]|nr:3-dehydroquinate synthase family protein [Acidimicrobiales bacterium]
MVRIPVGLGERAYDVVIGDGAVIELKEVVAQVGASRAVVVTQSGIGHEVDTGLPQEILLMDSGEEAKSLATVEELCRGFANAGLTRRDLVVAVGGGVVTDTAGFAAASYHRGTSVIHVPTTLLAQVDAAIGGKTGVNLPEGKNLVGSFWQPAAVICDTSFLSTLPEREMRSGRGEVAKCELLGAAVTATSGLEETVAACVELKAQIVAADEREASGRRDLLNYGHTLAHALEIVGRYDLRHGEAVAIGLAFAARLARRLDRIPSEREREIVATVAGYDLPVAPPEIGIDTVLEVMKRDKKSRQGMRFVLDGPAGVAPVSVSEEDVRAALEDFVKLNP